MRSTGLSSTPIGLHVVGERGVAKSGALFGSRDRLVDRDRRIVGEKPHEPEDFAQRLARLMAGQDHVGHRDRAGIDERIARDAALEFQLDDGIERAPRRLAADPLPQPVADLAQGQRQREHLGNALDRKRNVGVAAGRDVAVSVDHNEAEGIGVGPGQFGDISRDLAAVRPAPHVVGDFFYDMGEVGDGVAHRCEALVVRAVRWCLP